MRGIIMQGKKIVVGLTVFGLVATTAYAANNVADVINATANFINALNGQPVVGEYRHFTPILANNMASHVLVTMLERTMIALV